MYGDPESVGVARIGEQFLRTVGIVSLDLEISRRTEHSIGEQLACRHGFTLHNLVDDRIAVDRLGQRLAHAWILQRIS